MLIQCMADVYKPRKSQSPPPKLFHMSMNGSSGIPRQVFLPRFIIFVVIIIIVDTTATTGWSKKTVNCDFFVTGVKITKNSKTQPFLESLYATILIFQCLSMVRWQKLSLSGLCLNRVFAPYCMDWEPTYPPSTSERLQFLWISLTI